MDSDRAESAIGDTTGADPPDDIAPTGVPIFDHGGS